MSDQDAPLVDVGGFDRVDGAAVPGDYVRWMAHQRRHGPDVAMAELGVGRSDRVLDLGCGTGADLASLADSAGHVVGLDRSLAMSQKAQSCVAVDIGSVVNGDGHRLPFPDECFDACWIRAVLVHADDPRQVLDEVCGSYDRRGVAVAAAVSAGEITASDAARYLASLDSFDRRGAFVFAAMACSVSATVPATTGAQRGHALPAENATVADLEPSGPQRMNENKRSGNVARSLTGPARRATPTP